MAPSPPPKGELAFLVDSKLNGGCINPKCLIPACRGSRLALQEEGRLDFLMARTPPPPPAQPPAWPLHPKSYASCINGPAPVL